jgi:hypothetical protein
MTGHLFIGPADDFIDEGLERADRRFPPAYILVLRAESANALAEHRVAVMEACSAAEVAADSVIERALTTFGCPEAFAEGVARRARGIRSAHGVLLKLNVPCGIKTDDVTKLAELRNKAAHGAGPVDWMAAHHAVRSPSP